MNEEYWKRGDGGQGNHPQPHYDFTEQPSYEFYEQGITKAHKGWFEAIFTLVRNARGIQIVTVVVVLALCKVACEFLEEGSNNLSYKSISGTLLVALMILTIGLVSLRRVEDTNVGQKENKEKNKNEPSEPRTGGEGQGQNRRTSARDRSSNLDGGGK